MDVHIPNNLSNGNSTRRRLTKKPPPSHHHHSSTSIDGRIDAQSLQSKRSSASLKRVPSAPPTRTPTSNASNNSSPRYPPSFTNFNNVTNTSSSARSNPSPILPTAEYPGDDAASAPSAAAAAATSTLRDERNSDPLLRGPLTRAPEDFVGAPFDGAAILSRIEATKSPSLLIQPAAAVHFPSLALPLQSPPAAMGPPLQQSASYPQADPVVSEKSQGPKTTDNQLPPAAKRYSDEPKDAKPPGVLRKKSGFSGFMTSLVGSPKKPLISAPENPVHVTHVGYDSTTGQFTVGFPLPCFFFLLLVLDSDWLV